MRTDTHRGLSIGDFITRMIQFAVYGIGESISVSSQFQRGDEETGVWTKRQQQEFIDSVQRSFPFGIITLVKDHQNAMSYSTPWLVLDGGNRCRALRDFKNGLFADIKGRFFKDLNPFEQAHFETKSIPCIWITIEREDPPWLISEMFTRLNTSAVRLSNGELIKAHGWKSDVSEIEMAKKMIGHPWNSDFVILGIEETRAKWASVLGDLGENNRCDTLAAVCSYIISAKESDFVYFEPKYNKICHTFSNPNDENDPNAMTQAKQDMVLQKLNDFLDLVKDIPLDKLLRIQKGIPSKTKVAPLWKPICEGTMTPEFRVKLVKYFNEMYSDQALRKQYEDILTKGGDNHASNNKIDNVLQMIEER